MAQKKSPSTSTAALLPHRALIWLATALIFALPPLFDALAPWVPFVFVGSLFAKFWIEKKGLRLRSMIWQCVGVAALFGGVMMSFGSLNGFEPQMSILLSLASLKILESHTAREFHMLVMLGWFLCLCGFLNSQDLVSALCVFAAFALLIAATVEFHRGASLPAEKISSKKERGTFWPPLRVAFKLLLQTAPLVVILFLFFPRVAGGFRFYLVRGFSPGTGLSERLSPGSIASIAASQNVAFRAEFSDDKIPLPSALYWRAAVIWRGDGLNWQAGPPAEIAPGALRASGEAMHQIITIEPHGERWMFALDWPLRAPPGAALMPGNYLRSERPLSSSRRYEVTSFRDVRETEPQPAELRVCLRVSGKISQAVRDLAQSWKSQSNNDPRAIVQSALAFFHKGGFRYSISPGDYNGDARDALDEFLFKRKVGFCEHYAASFATLMRVAGVPSRVVIGYLGGEFNSIGRYIVVRQSHAHAWCEVWLPGRGWTRVDPTSEVAPERVSLGLGTFFESSETASAQGLSAGQAGAGGILARHPFANNLRLAWDTLNYTWTSRVLSFDSEEQQTFLGEMNIGDVRPGKLLAWLCFAALMLLCGYGFWMWKNSRAPRDAVKTLYERFCRRAAKLGAERFAWEGPRDFSDRAARLLPDDAERIRRVTNDYIALRYSFEKNAANEKARLLKKFANEVRAFSAARSRRPKKSNGDGQGAVDSRDANQSL